ncbi:hypothetical protein ACH4TV_47690 [Streptomyces sp. NPDC020898]
MSSVLVVRRGRKVPDGVASALTETEQGLFVLVAHTVCRHQS